MNPTKPGRWKAICTALFCLVLSTSAARAAGPSEELFELSAKDLAGGSRKTRLPTVWRYHPGDDPAFAAHGFDDTTWDEVDTRLGKGVFEKTVPPGWSGLGWFRLHFRVDPDLQDVALSLLVRQAGAAEVYLDGELLLALGTVDADAERAVARFQRQPHLFAFDGRAEHVLALRYSHHESTAGAAERVQGFVVTVGNANHRLAVYSDELRSHSAYRAFFTGVFASFALLHLLLFVFYPEARENLYFALLAISVAMLVYLFLHRESTTDPRFIAFSDRGLNTTWLLICVFAAGFVYSVFQERMPRRFYLVAGAAAALLVPGWLWPRALTAWILLLVFLTTLEMCRTVVVALYRKKPGARIVGLGILILAGGFAVGLAASLDVLPASMATVFLIPFFSMFVLMVTMSVYLSRKFAHANRELRTQLMQVEELSEHKLEQERRAREDAVERTLLKAEYARKVEELEEARKLQLSMLPEHLPDLPDLEVAAGMHTATEVGGDYYDFDVAADGTLTVAIGDATGHGMKAGTMVTATKSLFNTLDESDLSQTLSRFTRALKRMNLHQLSMALTLVRFKDGRLHLAAAGMPPALIWRAASNRVEEFQMAGAPLGSLTGFPYQQTELELAPGDTVLLMSDGFPERLNGDHEMLGYDKAQEAFTRAAPTSPKTIIERLVADGDAWAKGQPALDDMTFVVLKMRGGAVG